MNIKLKVLTILGVVLLLSCDVLDIRGKGYISITTQPTGCEIYIDGDATGDTTNCVLGDIPKGLRMTLGLVKEDYLDWGGWVEVSGVDTLYIEKTFTGSLKVTSNPSGAGIILDGESTSQTTPHTFDSLIVGPHSLRLEHEGAATLDSSIVVNYGEQAEVNVNLSEHYGHIQVNSTPTEAEIWLDGSNTGYTTNRLIENVALGEHEIKLTLDGYVDWYDTVTVSEGQTEYIVATLDEATGNIQVNSTPTGADIYLDGSNTGKTTNALLEDVSPGLHTICLVLEPYLPYDTIVTVNAGITTNVDVTFSSYFFDNFDDDPLGGHPSSIWDVSDANGEVAISSIHYGDSGRSCGFKDETQWSLTAIGADVSEVQKGTINFCWKTQTSDDVFAFFAYDYGSGSPESQGYWVAIYLNVGFWSDYIYAVTNNYEDYVKICSYSSNTWYQMRIEFNQDQKSYDVYVNGSLKKADIPFCGDSIQRFDRIQFGSLGGAMCSQAYVDEINLETDSGYLSSDGWGQVLADPHWLKSHHDNKNTGRYCGP